MPKRIPSIMRRRAGPPPGLQTRSQFAGPGSWIGVHSQAGVIVTPETAFNLSAVFCAINIISTDLACLPTLVYRGGAEDPDHPLADLLRDEPNDEVDAFHFTGTLAADALSTGNGYAEIGRSRRTGTAGALWRVEPRDVQPARTHKGNLVFEQAGGPTLLAEDVLHFKGLSRDGIVGRSVVNHARQTIGLGTAAEIYGASYFGNGAQVGGFLKTSKAIKEEAQEELREAFGRRHGGPYNAHAPGILVGDYTWVPTALGPEASQFLATRQFSVVEIARWFNINPIKLMDFTNGRFSNIEQAQLDHVNTCLMPWIVNYESELNRKLLTRDQRRVWRIKHDLTARLRGDSAARMAYYKNGFMIGVLSQNDIRRMEDLTPIANGDVYYIPVNNMGTGAPPGADATQERDGWIDPPAKPADKPRPPDRAELVDAALDNLAA